MDEEDLREAEEARVLETSESFAGIGGGGEAELRGGLMGLLVTSETMGTRLLKKMGWKEGQGVGARRLRRAAGDEGKEYLFAPENSPLVGFVRKDGAAGLGYEGEAGLAKRVHIEEEEAPTRRAPKKSAGAAFGVGILNDDGEDDEDPYEIRPKTLYNKTIGGDKPRKKAPAKHVFIPKKSTALKPHQSFRKCHDGRLPLPGFILSDAPVPPAIPRYPPPVVPDSWNLVPAEPAAAAPAAQEGPKLDPRTRGALLGEAPLPGKSVFDFLTPDARNRIANLTGKAHLPPGLGEAPASTTRSTIADLVPALDSEASLSALKGGFMPYGDDPDKRARYRSFLEVKAGLREGLPERVRPPAPPSLPH